MLGDISYQKATLQSEGKHSIHIHFTLRGKLVNVDLFSVFSSVPPCFIMLSELEEPVRTLLAFSLCPHRICYFLKHTPMFL